MTAMNPRKAWRLLNRLVALLAVPDARTARPAGRVVLFSCSDLDRGMTEGGLRYSPQLQGIRDIVEDLGLGAVHLTHPFASFRSAQVKDGAITINYRTVALRLVALLLWPLGRKKSAALRKRLEVALYAHLLRSIRPEVVFSIQPPFALCQAARQVGIRVVEALHGSNISLSDRIFREHMANPEHWLAHVYLAFDDVTRATFSTFGAGRDMVTLRTDDPWLHSCRRYRQRWQHIDSVQGQRCVLVTLQWGYDGERDSLSNIIPNGVVHPTLEAAIAATTGSGIVFWLRLHPIQMNAPGYRHHRRVVQALARRYPHVEFEQATALPLPLLLEQASAHITMSSSSVGEAAVAGVPSLMLCPTLHPGGAHDGMFRELAAAGQVTFGRLDAAAIVDWIKRCPNRAVRDEDPEETRRRHERALSFYADLVSGPGAAPAGATALIWCKDVR